MLQPEEGPTTEQTDAYRGTAAPGQLEQLSLKGCSPGQSLQGTGRNQGKSRRGRSPHEPPCEEGRGQKAVQGRNKAEDRPEEKESCSSNISASPYVAIF